MDDAVRTCSEKLPSVFAIAGYLYRAKRAVPSSTSPPVSATYILNICSQHGLTLALSFCQLISI